MSAQVLADNRQPVNDNDLQKLESHLQSRLNGRVRNLRILVRDRGLILQGQAHTYYAKQLAQHAVMEVINPPILVNDIEVSAGASYSQEFRGRPR